MILPQSIDYITYYRLGQDIVTKERCRIMTQNGVMLLIKFLISSIFTIF